MALIFLGGARGVGKSSILRELKGCFPRLETLALSDEVKRHVGSDRFCNGKPGMRKLRPEDQCTTVSAIIQEAKGKSASSLLVIDGHYISTFCPDGEYLFFPLISENGRLFDQLLLIKLDPYGIITRRRFAPPSDVQDRKIANFDFSRRECFAEGLEAKHLSDAYQKPLTIGSPEHIYNTILRMLRTR